MAKPLIFGSLEAKRQSLILSMLSLEDGTGKCSSENKKLHVQLTDQIREISDKILLTITEEREGKDTPAHSWEESMKILERDAEGRIRNDDLLRPWIKFSDQIPNDGDVCDVLTAIGLRTAGVKFSAAHGMFLEVVMSATKVTATCYFADSWRLSKNA